MKRKSSELRSQLRCIVIGIVFLYFSFHFLISIIKNGKEENSNPQGAVLRVPLSLTVETQLNCTPQAISNFPRDKFTNAERRKGAVIFHLFVALYMFCGLAIVCDNYFVPCLEIICEVLKLQEDVAGATFMAAGSSAPELATTLIGVFIAKDDIGLGAVVGSADYNIMFVISMCALFARTTIKLNWWPLVRDCFVYCLSIIALAVVIRDDRVYWFEAFVMLIMYVIYVILMGFNRSMEKYFVNKFPNFGRYNDDERIIGNMEYHLLNHSTNHRPPVGDVDEDEEEEEEDLDDISLVNRTNNNKRNVPSNRDNNNDVPYPIFHDNIVDVRVMVTDNLENNETTTTSNGEMNKISTNEQNDYLAALRWPVKMSLEEYQYNSIFATFISANCFYRLSCFIYIIMLPLKIILFLTTPDCRQQGKWKYCFALTFVMSCLWISAFSYLMIWMITVTGHTIGIADTIMALTFIAAGSSVPDAIASVIVVREGQGDMAVSNAVGSNVFDILICMGLPWMLRCLINGEPVAIYSRGLLYATFTLFSTVIILLVSVHINRWRLTVRYGFFLLFIYFAYLVICSLFELNLFGIVHLPECKFND